MYSPPPGGQPPMGGGGPLANGQNIMIIGIVSLFCAGLILGPIARVQGNAALKTLGAYGDPTGQRSPVTTGRLCGIIAIALSAAGIIATILVGAAGLSHPHSVTPTP